MSNAVEVRGLVRSIAARPVLAGIDLTVPEGSVTAVLGRNGAGKTTLFEILLGMVLSDSGHCSVLGLDPRYAGHQVRALVGYVPERSVLPDELRVDALLGRMRAFYPTWDRVEEERLRAWLDIPTRQRVGQLSRGARAKLGLLLALAHRPRLLLLDEHVSGLDPVAREEVLEAVVDLCADGDRTVVLSSHRIEDVERIADHVAFLAGGRIRAAGPIEDLRDRVSAVTLEHSAADHEDALASLERSGILHVRQRGHAVTALCEGAPEPAARRLAADVAGATVLESRRATLDDLFRAYAVGREEGEP